MPRTTADGPTAARPPTGSTGHRAALAGLTGRHWGLLALIAEHGGFNTIQITTLMFDSRPTAVRHIRDLYTAGLLWRNTSRRDPSHLARYMINFHGTQALEHRLRETGRTRIPVGLGDRGRDDPSQEVANDFFVRLIAHARGTGQGHLYRWRHGIETTFWLLHHGVPDTDPNGHGLWIQDNTSVNFLLHLDREPLRTGRRPGPPPLDTVRGYRRPGPPPSESLSGYRRAQSGVPADAVLFLTTSRERELRLHRELAEAPLPLVVAATTYWRLYNAASPTDAIWSVDPAADQLRPLVEIASRQG